MTSKSNGTAESLHEYIRQSYRGKTAYADRMPDEFLIRLHIHTTLDKEILGAVRKGKNVILTGNPGDGKTHILRMLQKDILKTSPAAVIELDASEKSNEQIIKDWKAADRKRVPFCAAINEAVLKTLADDFPDFAPPRVAQRQVEDAIVYQTSGEKPPCEVESNVVVFDLSRRCILSNEIVSEACTRLTDAAAKDAEVECLQPSNDFSRNLRVLRTNLFKERLQLLFDRLTRRGYHATLRELQAFVSYLVFRGCTCTELGKDSGDSRFYPAELVFSGEGSLFDALRVSFDPAYTCHPIWDDKLIQGEIQADTWQPAEARAFNALLPEELEQIMRRRRRFFFCNSDGISLLSISHDIDSEYAAFLRATDRDATRELFKKVNAIFRFSESDDTLRVWKCHRFDHGIAKVFSSTTVRHRKDFEIGKPVLRSPASKAFLLPDDHRLLRLKDDPTVSLYVDYQLYFLLTQAEQGLPILSLQNHLTRRIWSFMERLFVVNEPNGHGEMEAYLLDVQSGKRMLVSVDIETGRYLSVKGE